MEQFLVDRAFEMKDNLTPVTTADLRAEKMIRRRIAERYPGEDVLGEEEGGDQSRLTRWVVDPIDGTKSFVSGVPLYATLIAFEEEGEPVIGVAHFPALGETVYAERGQGSYWNGERCRVTDNMDLSRAVISCGGHAAMVERGRMAGLLTLADKCMATRSWCDAYGHALVATGRIDAMVDPRVSRWDISAMSLIVREAGGSFTDFKGAPELSDEAVSCSPQMLEAVLEAFRA